MTWIVESPAPAIVVGLLILAILAIALLRTGRGVLLAVMAAVAAVTVALVLLEWAVETEVERVETELQDFEAALESNDLKRILSHIDPQASRVRAIVEGVQPKYEITTANVGRDLEVTINELTSPATATAVFTARVHGGDRQGTISGGTWINKLTLILRRHGDRWLIYDYDVNDRTGILP